MAVPVAELAKGLIALLLIQVFAAVVQGVPEVASQRVASLGGTAAVKAGAALLSVVVLGLMWSPAGTTLGQIVEGLYRAESSPP